MIMRFYLIAGVLLLGTTAYFIVVQQEPDYQAAPLTSEITKLQDNGLLATGPFEENDELEHGVFEVPPMDEMMLEQAESSMDMAGMDMTEDDTMTMADGTTMPMADMDMAEGNAMTMAVACAGERGLGFCDDGQAYDREVEVAMSEWTFSNLDVAVQAGERIRFTVRNDGTVLHEFMFMAMEQMQAVNYRARRADWNLLEHEALFEQSLLLPGESISFVIEVQNAGSWMFMCMLPYHMQMGMMGQMSTPGAGMDM
tara:strand:- start:13030 stop:13794 length:765 start_codon:yes stop_codon:yes gene_type:complete